MSPQKPPESNTEILYEEERAYAAAQGEAGRTLAQALASRQWLQMNAAQVRWAWLQGVSKKNAKGKSK